MATEDSALIERDPYAPPEAARAGGLPRQQFISGARTMAPFMASAIPMALLGGAFGVNSGLDGLTTLALAMAVNSGTVQFVGIRLIQENANWAVVLLTSLILSLRLMIYSTVLRPHMHGLSQRWRLLLGFGLIDAVFFVVLERFKKDGDRFPGWPWFYFGASAAMYVTWMTATVAGIAVGGALPDLISHGLDFPMTAVFAAMLASTLVNRRAWAIVSTAGVLALLASPLPFNLGLIVATIGGTLVGSLWDRAEQRRAPATPEAS